MKPCAKICEAAAQHKKMSIKLLTARVLDWLKDTEITLPSMTGNRAVYGFSADCRGGHQHAANRLQPAAF
jgi:hypothetical protein